MEVARMVGALVCHEATRRVPELVFGADERPSVACELLHQQHGRVCHVGNYDELGSGVAFLENLAL
jgi:hypothetical protein